MARPSVVAPFTALLTPYLDAKMVQYRAQPEHARTPTLPSHGGKVNVRQVTLDLGLPQCKEFHFYTKPELRKLIDAVAVAQGLDEIGSSRRPGGADDDGTGEIDEAAKLVASHKAETKRQAEGHAQKSAQVGRLAQRVSELEMENAVLVRRNDVLQQRLRHMQQTGTIVRAEDVQG